MHGHVCATIGPIKSASSYGQREEKYPGSKAEKDFLGRALGRDVGMFSHKDSSDYIKPIQSPPLLLNAKPAMPLLS